MVQTTIGCISITDEKIKELYVLTVEAKKTVREKFRLYLPDHLNLGVVEKLVTTYPTGELNKEFWKNLQSVYLDFKSTRKLKPIKVNAKDEYSFKKILRERHAGFSIS